MLGHRGKSPGRDSTPLRGRGRSRTHARARQPGATGRGLWAWGWSCVGPNLPRSQDGFIQPAKVSGKTLGGKLLFSPATTRLPHRPGAVAIGQERAEGRGQRRRVARRSQQTRFLRPLQSPVGRLPATPPPADPQPSLRSTPGRMARDSSTYGRRHQATPSVAASLWRHIEIRQN